MKAMPAAAFFALLWAGQGFTAQPDAIVHVNQVALERNGPKAAIVEYVGSEKTGKFSVLVQGRQIYGGELQALPQFTEWGSGKRYFKADFTPLATAGEYQVQATIGASTVVSPPFRLADEATFVTTAAAILDYFKANRHTNAADRHIRIYDTQRYVDVYGGWKDAGGDNGKYLSHLSYANYFNPQQTSLVVWALAKAYDTAPHLFERAALDRSIIEESMWGADYLHRLLDPEGFFYMTVFDRWGTEGAERVVTGYVGMDGVYTKDYQAAFREGGGVAIAALARASTLSRRSGIRGEFSDRYLQDAEKAFAHLQKNNSRYCDDGVENIIDDYTALLAAVELFHATRKPQYLTAARMRAANLSSRMTSAGWFRSDASDRPYYHGVEAGFPILALTYYLEIENDAAKQSTAKKTILRALDHQLALNKQVANPFNYARQNFRPYKDGRRNKEVLSGFFMPHANESNYWWQGESARLASLAAAAVIGGRIVAPDSKGAFGVRSDLAEFAQNQLDWTLGRNPFDMCMLYGFGAANPPFAESAGDMVKGGISNGITGATLSDEGRGIVWAEGPDDNNWRWIEQWLPHSTWFLLASTSMASMQTRR